MAWIGLAHLAVVSSCEPAKKPTSSNAPTEAVKGAEAAGKGSAGQPAVATPPAGMDTGSGSGGGSGESPGATAGSGAVAKAETTELSASVVAAAARATVDPVEELFPDRAVRGEISDQMQRRIRFRLRTVAKAPIALRDTVSVPFEDGHVEVFALYEYSLYEECVRGYPNRKEGRDQCLTSDPGTSRLGINRGCVGLGVVHASFAAPAPDDTSDGGGAVTVSSAPLSDTLCIVAEIKRVFADDIDGDGRHELYADLVTSERSGGEYRSGREDGPTYYSTSKRTIAMFSGGATPAPPFTLHLSTPPAGIGDLGSAPEGELVMLRDLNRDGHRDVVKLEPCRTDGFGDVADQCDPEHPKRTIYLYDARRDSWIEGTE